MPLLVPVIGPAGAGKSTCIKHCIETDVSFGSVEVGKALRKKYGDGYFKGQGNPLHTAGEAWELCVAGVLEQASMGKTVILIDGQPRDLPQVDLILGCKEFAGFRRLFVLLHASEEKRLERITTTRTGDSLVLGQQRVRNDMAMYYAVLARLLTYGIVPRVYDSTNDLDVNGFRRDLVVAAQA